jgi:hypothetical protein
MSNRRHTSKKTIWWSKRIAGGCEFCGRRLDNIPHNGLDFCHIVSLKDEGTNHQENILALCPNCHQYFDYIVKPAYYWKLRPMCPESWRTGEGRYKQTPLDSQKWIISGKWAALLGVTDAIVEGGYA